ncbi:hypothetical protein [Xenorhabdus bharatensis]|uniref:hypothetical protein n=1 Tax=Xenorhabdus bharatensis TaxID=3136256 RepID=UPI0030F466B6
MLNENILAGSKQTIKTSTDGSIQFPDRGIFITDKALKLTITASENENFSSNYIIAIVTKTNWLTVKRKSISTIHLGNNSAKVVIYSIIRKEKKNIEKNNDTLKTNTSSQDRPRKDLNYSVIDIDLNTLRLIPKKIYIKMPTSPNLARLNIPSNILISKVIKYFTQKGIKKSTINISPKIMSCCKN